MFLVNLLSCSESCHLSVPCLSNVCVFSLELVLVLVPFIDFYIFFYFVRYFLSFGRFFLSWSWSGTVVVFGHDPYQALIMVLVSFLFLTWAQVMSLYRYWSGHSLKLAFGLNLGSGPGLGLGMVLGSVLFSDWSLSLSLSDFILGLVLVLI